MRIYRVCQSKVAGGVSWCTSQEGNFLGYEGTESFHWKECTPQQWALRNRFFLIKEIKKGKELFWQMFLVSLAQCVSMPSLLCLWWRSELIWICLLFTRSTLWVRKSKEKNLPLFVNFWCCFGTAWLGDTFNDDILIY